MGMKSLADKIKSVVDTNWSMINTFTVDMHISSELYAASGVNPELFKVENLNLVIKDFPLPQHSVQDVDAQTGLINRHTMGRIQAFTFDVTFRDRDQLAYYRAFKHLFDAARWMYPDDAAIDFIVYKDSDYALETDIMPVDIFRRCIIVSVSQLQFNQETDAQIAEFSVQFSCSERFPQE